MFNWVSPRKLKKVSLSIYNSIAFNPALIAGGLFFLAILCMFLDANYDTEKALDVLPFLKINNPNTARSALSALAGGLMTLMVFSFTMVMVVLNMTATNFSPRALPSLISQRSHQNVLGIYLGAIAYTLTILTNIDSEYYPFIVPRLSYLVNAVLGFVAFGSFVYFIHNISESIQVGQILSRLFRSTRATLKKEQEKGVYTKGWEEQHQLNNWQVRSFPETGYFDAISTSNLRAFCEEEGLVIKLLVVKGAYVVENQGFIALNKELDDEKLEKLWSFFIFRHQEIIEQNYLFGFKQIGEIAAKALSPGINDPGTAVQAIDYLTELFQHLFKLNGNKVLLDEEDKPFLVYPEVPLESTLHLLISQLVQYGKSDLVVMLKIHQLLHYLYSKYREGERGAIIRRQLADFQVKLQACEHFSAYDRELFKKEID